MVYLVLLEDNGNKSLCNFLKKYFDKTSSDMEEPHLDLLECDWTRAGLNFFTFITRNSLILGNSLEIFSWL